MKRDEKSIYLQYLDAEIFLRLSNDPKTHKVDELIILHPSVENENQKGGKTSNKSWSTSKS